MSSGRLILHFGNDSLLAEARILVLEDAGYEVIAADTHAAALRFLRTRRVSLVIACHSVPPEDLEFTVRQMKHLRPRIPLIMVHVGGLVRPQRSHADGFIDGLRGPEHMLYQVATFITRNATAAAG